MRRHLPFIFSLLAASATAQSWCPPGATWTFGISGWGMNAYQVFSYAADSLIDGLPAQRIEATMYYTNGISEGVDTSHWTVFTAYQDDIVLQYDEALIPPQWDTLYWFGEIGDRWWPIGSPATCATMGMVEILDTSTTIIDGLPLRRWELIYLDSLGQPMFSGSVMMERLGTAALLVPIWDCDLIIDYFFFDYRCYSDIDIQYMANGITTCDFFLGMNEPGIPPGSIHVWPNPAGDELQLDLPMAFNDGMLRVFTAQGTAVIERNVLDADQRLQIGWLAPGIYLLELRDPQGGRWQARWVKE